MPQEIISLETDKQKIDDAIKAKKPIDYAALKRVVMTELAVEGAFKIDKIYRFTREQIQNVLKTPEKYGNRIVQLSQYMYLKSGYYKKLIKYYSTMARYLWTVDSEIQDHKGAVKKDTFLSRLYRFITRVNNLGLKYELENILLRMFLNDACFGYLVDNGSNSFIYYLDPLNCEIKGTVNGMYMYAINVNRYNRTNINTLPDGLKELVVSAKKQGLTQVMIPMENNVCFKYNEHFAYLHPPFFHLIMDILDIDNYKYLAKAKTEQECYRMLIMKIPVTDSGISLGEEDTSPYIEIAKYITPDAIGVLPSTMDVEAVQFKSDQAERNKVEDATSQFYAEAGVSQALMSGATSGSELAMSVKADSGDIYRIYRQIERFVNFQMDLRGVSKYQGYVFRFAMMDMTIFNSDDVVDRELKLAQASIPNKMRLAAACGVTPEKLFGNMMVENQLLNLSEEWTVLKTSSTQSATQNSTGRPQSKDDEISEVTETGRENDSNLPDNRI